jgi:hypothetical protein
VQTAFYMNGSAVPEKEWLGTCEQTLLSDVRTHKAPNRNLLLVTHSGCIGKFERQLDFPHAPTAEYNSALFVSVAADGTVKVLGIMNPDEWPAALGHKPADLGASPASTNGVPAEKQNPAL